MLSTPILLEICTAICIPSGFDNLPPKVVDKCTAVKSFFEKFDKSFKTSTFVPPEKNRQMEGDP